LVVITAAEVSLSYAHVGRLFLPTILILMTVKFFMVVLFFMHLRFDAKMFGRLFYAGLVLAVAVYVATLTTFQFWVK
jgi:cytochrome c oxidase subunit 4